MRELPAAKRDVFADREPSSAGRDAMIFAQAGMAVTPRNDAMGAALHQLSLAEYLVWENDQTGRNEYWRGEVFGLVGVVQRHGKRGVTINSAAAAAPGGAAAPSR